MKKQSQTDQLLLVTFHKQSALDDSKQSGWAARKALRQPHEDVDLKKIQQWNKSYQRYE